MLFWLTFFGFLFGAMVGAIAGLLFFFVANKKSITSLAYRVFVGTLAGATIGGILLFAVSAPKQAEYDALNAARQQKQRDEETAAEKLLHTRLVRAVLYGTADEIVTLLEQGADPKLNPPTPSKIASIGSARLAWLRRQWGQYDGHPRVSATHVITAEQFRKIEDLIGTPTAKELNDRTWGGVPRFYDVATAVCDEKLDDAGAAALNWLAKSEADLGLAYQYSQGLIQSEKNGFGALHFCVENQRLSNAQKAVLSAEISRLDPSVLRSLVEPRLSSSDQHGKNLLTFAREKKSDWLSKAVCTRIQC